MESCLLACREEADLEHRGQVALEGALAAAILQAPHLQGAVARGSNEGTLGGAELDSPHPPLVPTECPHLHQRRQLPDLQHTRVISFSQDVCPVSLLADLSSSERSSWASPLD